MKKVFRVLVLLLVMSLVFASSGFAKNDHARKSLVALGDSIPFGYNLGEDNLEPSENAFPFLMQEGAKLKVNNLAIPGLKTDGLLYALQNEKDFRKALKHSDYVTLNIGNNDLLSALKQAYAQSNGNSQLLNYYLMQNIAASKMFENVSAIVAEIRELTNAPIVIYNFYNPFQVTDPLHYLALNVLPGINLQLKALTDFANSAHHHIALADAYTAFGRNQIEYVIPNDIHPTIAGQKVLAELGLQALGLKE